MGARFLRLGIAGFKSFADATTLEILPGLTGVVGPNGCGKSNVAEALRWAMGEANARHLRGGEMDDVIFAGTAHRPSRNLAEVSLHLEGDGDGLPPPFAGHAELQVTRRIERGGGSAYRVNGREARARDVQTLFADLASGARASAMVSQGRVGALVGASPADRRAVLEEAAGISGLHARRAEAETRLRATEANIETAEARRGQLDAQLTALNHQAKQAARYRTVVEAVLDTEALLLAIQRQRGLEGQAEAAAALQAANGQARQAALAGAAAAAAAADAQARVPPLRDAEADARTTLERARLAEEMLAAEAARTEAALRAAHQRREHLARDQAHAEAVLNDAADADARLVAEAEQLDLERAAHPELLAQASTAAETAAAALAEADRCAAETARLAATAQAVNAGLRQVLDQAEARARRAQDAADRLTADQARATAHRVDPARLDAARTAATDADRMLADTRVALDQADLHCTQTAQAAALARDARAAADALRHRLAAEVRGVTEVLAVKDGERWPPLLDQITVPPGLEAALGAVLGEDLGAAEDQAAARHWRALPALPPADLPGRRLSELVSASPLLDRALEAIALVGSSAEADQAQPGLSPGQSLVSAEGGVWRWDGYIVRPGAPTAAAVRLQQRNRLLELQTGLAAAEQEATYHGQASDWAEAAHGQARQAEQRLRAARQDAERAADQARAAAASLAAAAETAAARAAALRDQTERLTPEWQEAAAGLAAARAEHAAQPDSARLSAEAAAARTVVGTARAADHAAYRALDTLQRADQARQARHAAVTREREDRAMRAADLRGRVADLVARAAEAAAEHDRLAAAPAQAVVETERARATLTGAEAVMHAATQALREAENAAAVAVAAARDANHAAFAARESVLRAEAANQAAAAARDGADSRIAERASALPPLPQPADISPQAEERTRLRQHRLTRERDDMGPVNLRAGIEAQALEAEITAIDHDRAELATAVAKLRGSVGHLNREGRERLSATFHVIDGHFQTLFARMFGGGRAHLALVGSDDPLLAGLEIYAQPPGKKLTSLALLSGGEQALTALSLIFAVFRCNPAPLCVLDEVDAPLDDANVERFCALLADMVAETGTRFLVVTHHQVTMARMDRLYGVTMQERGVSRLLSVDLARAAAIVDAMPAGTALAAE